MAHDAVWFFDIEERLARLSGLDGQREAFPLSECGAALFNRFDATLKSAGCLPLSGQILDATLVAAPKQRNTNDEKTALTGLAGQAVKAVLQEASCTQPPEIRHGKTTG